MGIFQAAYQTYQSYAHLAGVAEGKQKALTPVSHMVQNAHIEITITDEGVFQGAIAVPKEDAATLIPATMESANRTSGICPHPLCDYLVYLAQYGGEKYAAYCAQLAQWDESEFSHQKVRAVRRYITGGSIVADLVAVGLVTPGEDGAPGSGKIEGAAYDKCLVRWRVTPNSSGNSMDCWRDSSLFASFDSFYQALLGQREQALCLISGQMDIPCQAHPKGVVRFSNGAKLISANDSAGFTYRGRFTQPEQALSIGYVASQKAHSALRWLVDNESVFLGGRAFLCWNPQGAPVPQEMNWGLEIKKDSDFISYQNQLRETLRGCQEQLKGPKSVVVAALEAATTGRLSVTYYNELRGSDFLARLEHWYSTCCWDTRGYGVRAPMLRRLITYAFGTQHGQFIEADDSVLREHVQQMLHCMLEARPIPQNIVGALVNKASRPLANDINSREEVLWNTCALVRKYRNDRAKTAGENEEVWKLALNTEESNRSYLFGRLLAVAEQVERSTYDRGEGREPNAIRMQAVFSQRPLYAWRIIEEKLNPYFARMAPGLQAYFKNILGEILDKLQADRGDLNQKLQDVYLLGYYHQRSALKKKKEAKQVEGNEDEHFAE